MTNFLPVLFGFFEAIWRRSHGGGLFHDWYDEYIKPWLKINYRVISVITNSIAIFCVGHYARDLNALQSCIFALTVWAFWDITFGMYMGIGNHPYPSEKDREEYAHQFPVSTVLDIVFPKALWYGVAYDFCGMWLRFTYPLIPLLFLPGFSLWILSLGLIVAVNYYINVWICKKYDPELMSGFFAGLFFVLI